MRSIPNRLRTAATALLLVAALAVSGCGSTGGGGGAVLAKPNIGTIEPGEAVTGNASATWKNLDPRNPEVTQTLVNASSEAGRALRSGRVSSSEVRVVSDEVMGTLLGELEDAGFFEHATPGMNLDNLPATPGRRGVVIVTRDGRSWGLVLAPGTGSTPIPATYRDCKALILAVHMSVQGLEVQVDVDENEVFSAPPIRMPRR